VVGHRPDSAESRRLHPAGVATLPWGEVLCARARRWEGLLTLRPASGPSAPRTASLCRPASVAGRGRGRVGGGPRAAADTELLGPQTAGRVDVAAVLVGPTERPTAALGVGRSVVADAGESLPAGEAREPPVFLLQVGRPPLFYSAREDSAKYFSPSMTSCPISRMSLPRINCSTLAASLPDTTGV
jgi:hypothetical protein